MSPTIVRKQPRITVSDVDHERLTRLAEGIEHRSPRLAEALQHEMQRAVVVPSGSVPADVVQMGSWVRFRLASGEIKQVTLVFSSEADFAEGRVSVLTPLGAALIGLTTGQSITWSSTDGREHELTVLTVEQPERAIAG
jgi:regulator of nucleoside diphosphate kinase